MRRTLLLPALAVLLIGAEDATLGGFDISSLSVPRELVVAGGRGRDPVRVVDEPRFVPPDEADWVKPDTAVIGLTLGDEARAYPVHLLEYHQVVNDVVGDLPVLVSYDPLTGTPRAYRRDLDGETLSFAVSGLFYNGGTLLYARRSQSLWSQFRGGAVAGPGSGRQLAPLPVRQETMGSWVGRRPGTRVLARPEPEKIDYRYSPYKAYWVDDRIPFPVQARDPRYHAKELVLGVEVAGRSRAYLGSLVSAAGLRVDDELAGRRIRIDYRPDDAVFVWEVPDDVRVTDAYWFAWKAFHPDTEIWNDARGEQAQRR